MASPRLTPSEKLRKRIEAAEFTRRMRDMVLPPPAPEPPSCAKHDWYAPRNAWWQPKVPAALCPGCRDEVSAKPTGPPVYLDGGYPKPETPELDERYAVYLEQAAGSGVILPGSVEEEDALSRIEELREEALTRDRRPARIVTERIEGGQRVTYCAPRRRVGQRGSLGLIRVVR